MKVIETEIPDLLILEPRVVGDSRGFFMESYSEAIFSEVTGVQTKFVQDNHSRSSKGVLRGLHYQLPPHAQGKLVRVTRGAVFDVAVDIRRNSQTFGQWVGVELTEENNWQFWIPAGFAHGFLVLSEYADFLYKTDFCYTPTSERCIAWNDPQINIIWPELPSQKIISEKDMKGAYLNCSEVF